MPDGRSRKVWPSGVSPLGTPETGWDSRAQFSLSLSPFMARMGHQEKSNLKGAKSWSGGGRLMDEHWPAGATCDFVKFLELGNKMTKDVTIKRGTPEMLETLGSMVDRVYRPSRQPGSGMPKEFPHLFHPLNAHNLFYAEYQGNPVSMIGVLKQTLIMPACSIPVASIGSVVTLPEYRGQQLATAVLEKVFQSMDDEGQALCLISGERQLYQRLGCVKTGRMFTVRARASSPSKKTPAFLIRRIAGEDRSSYASQLAGIYRQEPYRFQRSAQEMSVLLNALWFQRSGFHQELFVLETPASIAGYIVAFVTPSEPHQAHIMEWAGNREIIGEAWPKVMEELGVQSVIFHVHERDWWMRRLVEERNWEKESVPIQGTLKTAHVDTLLQSVRPLLEELGEWPWRYGKEGDVPSRLFGLPNEGGLGIPFVLTDDLNYI